MESIFSVGTLMDKVAEHIAAIRRRCEEAQEFAGDANAYTHDPVNRNMLEVVESNIEEARVILFEAMRECENIRSLLGLPRYGKDVTWKL